MMHPNEYGFEPDFTPIQQAEIPPGLSAIDFQRFLEMRLPVREQVIAPIVPAQGLVMIHAPRGIGKTQTAIGIAYAASVGGSFLRWQAPRARRVLYLDGEMPARTMQERLAFIAAANEAQPAPDFFRLITPDLQDAATPDISTREGQRLLEPHLEGVELVVLDNLSTLCRSGRENEAESWGPVQSWLLTLRQRGMSVLIVHHSNKSGGQRGTSRREDVLDTVISLRRPSDYKPSQGARFEVHLEKARGIFGEAAEPFEASLTVQDGRGVWAMRDLVDPTQEDAIRLLRQGQSIRAVAEALDVSKSAVGRWSSAAKEDGQLN
jgi:putative DNA primase/helicase